MNEDSAPRLLSGYPCWDKIDAAVCINLDKSTDRWQAFCKMVSEFLPEEKVHRVSAVVGVNLPGYGEPPWFTERTGSRASHWGGGGGCLLSHRNALRMAKERGWRNVLIFEDDAVSEVTPDELEIMGKALDELSGKWLLYLGYSASPNPCGKKIAQKGEASLWQINGAITTHAYIVPESMYDVLLDAMPAEDKDVWEWMARHRALDNFYRNEVSEWCGVKIYAILPLMFYQQWFYEKYELENGACADGPLRLSEYTVYPRTQCGLFSICHCLFSPLRRLKVALNSWRLHFVSRWRGFRGARKKKDA